MQLFQREFKLEKEVTDDNGIRIGKYSKYTIIVINIVKATM